MGRIRSLWLFLGLVLLAVSFNDVTADVTPSENECRPYIEKAIHELKNTESTVTESTEDETGDDASIETITTSEAILEENNSNDKESIDEVANDDVNSHEEEVADSKEENSEANTGDDDDGDSKEVGDEKNDSAEQTEDDNDNDTKEDDEEKTTEDNNTKEDVTDDNDDSTEAQTAENTDESEINATEDDGNSKETGDEKNDSGEQNEDDDDNDTKEDDEEKTAEDNNTKEEVTDDNDDSGEAKEETAETVDNNEDTDAVESLEENENNGAEDDDDSKEVTEEETPQSESDNDTKEDDQTAEDNDTKEEEEIADENEESIEEKVRSKRSVSDEATPEEDDDNDTKEETDESQENVEKQDETDGDTDSEEQAKNDEDSSEKATNNDDEQSEEQESEKEDEEEEEETMPEEELTLGFEIPKNLRTRTHIANLLGLDAESSIKENALKRTGDVILKELKRVYDNAIKPLETLYKYRDLSNRHFGDPEIFSKPLIVLMGPYSGGKSTILNYLTDNEYTPNSIRSGAEPSPAYFNILMHGDEPEVLDGTQLAADWTFSGLQKFGQGLMDRLRGQKLPSKLLERVNIVEIPGILEVRKQVSRYFPFNDACQWFIDRADIIFLVYDPAKLDVGPETEAILDQLKGREYQTRILLNKADTVKPEELLRVQSALIWNISPLMSSAQPPVMYTVSLWSHPFDQGAPIRLLQAQERALLSDLREAIDKRIENKIASARRFAVRIRNHAKMVDCYLTTYYNQKSLFSNKKQVSDKIIEHPQNYNIYEGLSTLTNISRYDLPDPEVYLDFFRLNPLYEFKKLSETCTYFKGCPINKLDIAIAYELPELVGKYKKLLEENYIQMRKEFDENCNETNTEPTVKLNSR